MITSMSPRQEQAFIALIELKVSTIHQHYLRVIKPLIDSGDYHRAKDRSINAVRLKRELDGMASIRSRS